MSGDEDVSDKRSRKATGPERPTYLTAVDVDRVMSVVLAIASEVASIRERLDAHERIAASGQAPSPENVEAYRPDSQTEQARETWRDAYIQRIFRVIMEDVEELTPQHGESDQ